jgi:hypothetical protein
MALMDKMKAQAQQLAQKAQEAGKAGQSKIEDVQAKRKWDGLLRDLGAAVYAQKSGSATADTDADVERIVKELTDLEAQNGPIDANASDASSAPESSVAPDTETTPEGGFKL